MKHILVCLILLFPLAVFSQNYKSIFSHDTTIWNVYHCEADAGGTIRYYSYSDTIISEKKYYKILRESIFSSNQPIGYESSVCGYIHEDTIIGKYWFLKIDNEESNEALFMDLNLNKGDSMGIISDFRYMWIDSVVVDTVYYEDEHKVILLDKFHYDCYNEYKIEFIEGIGASNGFYMGERYEQPDPYALLCKFNNGIQIYSSKSDINSNCYIDPGSAIKNVFLDKINIYPNPANNIISIELEMNSYADLFFKLYDFSGQLIMNKKIEDLNFKVNINQSGMFFIVITNGIDIYSKKIVIL